MFRYEIYNTNKTRYRDLNTYTEAKSEFILAKQIKDSNMKKISETKKSKDNIYRKANSGNN